MSAPCTQGAGIFVLTGCYRYPSSALQDLCTWIFRILGPIIVLAVVVTRLLHRTPEFRSRPVRK